MKPFFLILPMLDSTYLSWFKERQKVHKMLDEFIENIDGIIEEKRQLVKEKKTDNFQEEEKDLLTLMIESDMKGEGKGLTNEELRVIFFKFLWTCEIDVVCIERPVDFLYCRS